MENNISPKISILIPSYNHAAFIEKAIRSVWDQNCDGLELVVVDDGSKDNSREIISELAKISPIKMTVILQDNAGICSALNQALSYSTGEIIGFLASDDLMLPDRLNNEVYYFKSKPNLEVLYSNGQFLSNFKIFGEVHKNIKKYLKAGILETRNLLLSTAPGFYIQAMLIKRDFLLDLGGFDEETGSDDWSLNIRIFKSLQVENQYLFIDSNSFLYRAHPSQIHRAGDFMSPMKRRVVRKFFSLEQRSKFICQLYVKECLKLFLKADVKKSFRYFKKAFYIGFAEGIPYVCIFNYMRVFPGYIYRSCISFSKDH